MLSVKTLDMRAIAAVVLALAVGACSQPDGPVPAPDEAAQNEIGDVSRDIQGVLRKNLDSPKDLIDDLAGFSPLEESEAATRDFGSRLADVLPGRTMSEPDTERLANTLWVALSARELSEKQMESLRDDVQSMLLAAGVPQADAESVVAQLGEAQKVITIRQKRWYEFF